MSDQDRLDEILSIYDEEWEKFSRAVAEGALRRFRARQARSQHSGVDEWTEWAGPVVEFEPGSEPW